MSELKSAIERYLEDFLLLEKGSSQTTIKSYRTDLEQYYEFLADINIDRLDNIGLANIDAFLSFLREKDFSPNSVARKISAIRTFHRFCLNEGLTQNDPTEFLKIRLPHRRLPKIIPSEQMDRLMELPLGDAIGLRDKAMLEMLYGCGLRISELINLTLTQLHLQDEIIRVIGKRGKTRFVPLGSKAHKALMDYIEKVRSDFLRQGSKDEGVLFLNIRGKKLSRVGVYMIIKDYLERAFPGKNYTPHTLRHSFATHIIEGGGDIRTVQELLGHESIATTQIYTHLDRQYLRSVVKEYHPRG
jgi:integrase/recombinase XerD